MQRQRSAFLDVMMELLSKACRVSVSIPYAMSTISRSRPQWDTRTSLEKIGPAFRGSLPYILSSSRDASRSISVSCQAQLHTPMGAFHAYLEVKGCYLQGPVAMRREFS